MPGRLQGECYLTDVLLLAYHYNSLRFELVFFFSRFFFNINMHLACNLWECLGSDVYQWSDWHVLVNVMINMSWLISKCMYLYLYLCLYHHSVTPLLGKFCFLCCTIVFLRARACAHTSSHTPQIRQRRSQDLCEWDENRWMGENDLPPY